MHDFPRTALPQAGEVRKRRVRKFFVPLDPDRPMLRRSADPQRLMADSQPLDAS